MTTPVEVTTLPEGKFTRVTAVKFLQHDATSAAAQDEAPPRCEGCVAYAGKGYCLTWQATVPPEHLLTGCENRFEEFEAPF